MDYGRCVRREGFLISSKNTKNITDFLKNLKRQLPEIFRFGKKKLVEDVIGIDIGTKFIKVLKLKSAGEEYQVELFAHIPVPYGIVQSGEIKDNVLIARLINGALSQGQITSKNVAICIPRSIAIVKNLNVDKRLTSDEIESKVWIEVNRLFPNLVGNIYLDFSVLGPSTKDPNQLELLLVACRKEQLDPYLNVMRAAKLIPKIVDVNSYALERALTLLLNKQAQDAKTIALLNISFSWIDLIVEHEGNMVYVHELSYDGSALANQKNSAEIANIELLRNTLGLQLRHSLQFFYSSRPNIRVEKIFLVGDACVLIPGLKDFIQEEVGKEIVLGNPFANMQLAPNIDRAALEKVAPAFMLCAGLALSKLN